MSAHMKDDTFLKDCWYVAAQDHELDGEASVARQILAERVLLYRASAGEIVAFQDRCPHRFAPLSMGRRVQDGVRCAYHGMVFGPDGRCTHIPGQTEIPANARVRTYPVVRRHAHVWIWMGTVEKANPDLIPHIPWPMLEGWATARGYTHVKADYRLLNDNLLDLSHESYIHESTIGNEAAQSIANYPVQVTVKDGHIIQAHRDMPDIDPPPWFQMILGTRSRIDRWQTAIWLAPSINMTNTGAKPVGAPRTSAYVGQVLHLLTPETETSTHYFWSVCRNYRCDDADLTQSLREATRRTFDEDRLMLELQQRQITEGAGTPPQVALRVDNAPLRARRTLTTRIRAEQAGEVPAVPTPIELVDERAARTHE